MPDQKKSTLCQADNTRSEPLLLEATCTCHCGILSQHLPDLNSLINAEYNFLKRVFTTTERNSDSIIVKSQPICGPLGPNFGGFCANNTTKTKVATFRFCAIISTGAIKIRPQRGRITDKAHNYGGESKFFLPHFGKPQY